LVFFSSIFRPQLGDLAGNEEAPFWGHRSGEEGASWGGIFSACVLRFLILTSEPDILIKE
jgi:hypothetical protein